MSEFLFIVCVECLILIVYMRGWRRVAVALFLYRLKNIDWFCFLTVLFIYLRNYVICYFV